MHRLFVACRPPGPVRAALMPLMTGIPGARWQDDEQLHITLRFIGEVDRPVAEDLLAAMAQIHAPAMEVRIAGTGKFEHRGRTDAIWAGIAPHDALAHLHRKIDAALVRIGLPPEGRAYLPHVTLARFSRPGGASVEIDRWLADHAGLTSNPFALTHFGLYESRLSHNGAGYTLVERWPLH